MPGRGGSIQFRECHKNCELPGNWLNSTCIASASRQKIKIRGPFGNSRFSAVCTSQMIAPVCSSPRCQRGRRGLRTTSRSGSTPAAAGGPDPSRDVVKLRVPPVPRFWGPGISMSPCADRVSTREVPSLSAGPSTPTRSPPFRARPSDNGESSTTSSPPAS